MKNKFKVLVLALVVMVSSQIFGGDQGTAQIALDKTLGAMSNPESLKDASLLGGSPVTSDAAAMVSPSSIAEGAKYGMASYLGGKAMPYITGAPGYVGGKLKGVGSSLASKWPFGAQAPFTPEQGLGAVGQISALEGLSNVGRGVGQAAAAQQALTQQQLQTALGGIAGEAKAQGLDTAFSSIADLAKNYDELSDKYENLMLDESITSRLPDLSLWQQAKRFGTGAYQGYISPAAQYLMSWVNPNAWVKSLSAYFLKNPEGAMAQKWIGLSINQRKGLVTTAMVAGTGLALYMLYKYMYPNLTDEQVKEKMDTPEGKALGDAMEQATKETKKDATMRQRVMARMRGVGSGIAAAPGATLGYAGRGLGYAGRGIMAAPGATWAGIKAAPGAAWSGLGYAGRGVMAAPGAIGSGISSGLGYVGSGIAAPYRYFTTPAAATPDTATSPQEASSRSMLGRMMPSFGAKNKDALNAINNAIGEIKDADVSAAINTLEPFKDVNDKISRALEQLQAVGELNDAGQKQEFIDGVGQEIIKLLR